MMGDFDSEEPEGGFQNDMGGGFGQDAPPMDGGMDDNEFAPDFDAGVEADENEDPKKFIQQLTGKLSQSLRKYNQGLQSPDVDLNKYVSGMVVKQAIEGLSQEDAEEIIDKVKSDEPMDEPKDDGGNEMNGGEGMGGPQDDNFFNDAADNQERGPKHESVEYEVDNLISEITNGITDKKEMPKVVKDKTTRFKKKPFTAPDFE